MKPTPDDLMRDAARLHEAGRLPDAEKLTAPSRSRNRGITARFI